MRSRASRPRSSRRFGSCRARVAGRRTGGRREEPDPLRSRHRRLGRAVRVAEDALHEQRLPADWFDEVDYNSTRAVGDTSEVDQQIDDAIAALKQRTGKAQVDVVAHSLGTTVMYGYLTDGAMGAQRRANVGHYINVDGQRPQSRRATLAVWAGRGDARPQHGRREERHGPEPDPRAGLHLEGVVRRVLQVPHRRRAGARHRPAERIDPGRGKGTQLPARTPGRRAPP